MPSKSQKQADMFQHVAHDDAYAQERGVDQGVASAVHAEDIAEDLWGKTEGGPCPKCEKLSGEGECLVCASPPPHGGWVRIQDPEIPERYIHAIYNKAHDNIFLDICTRKGM